MKFINIYCICLFLLSAILTIVLQTSTVFAQSAGMFCAAIWAFLEMRER